MKPFPLNVCPQGVTVHKVNFLKLTVFALLCCGMVKANPVVTVVNLKDQSIIARLIAVTEKEVKLERVRDQKVFKLKLDQLKPDTVKMLREHAKTLPLEYPKLELNMVSGTRRKAVNGSFYMKEQKMTHKLKIENDDDELACPEIIVDFFGFGQDQRNPKVFKVLNRQKGKFKLEPGGEKEIPFAQFSTSYDSDNKGTGNIGGYKFYGYIAVLSTPKGKVLRTVTNMARLDKLLKEYPNKMKALKATGSGRDATALMAK